MNILAFDTSTEACSAALLRHDAVVFSRYELTPRQHQRRLPQMMDALIEESGLQKKDISCCAFANGPGAFTGIRIAAARAQGIGIALNIPLIPVSTLAILAQTAFDRTGYDRILVALDARMNEIYWGIYARNHQGIAELDGTEKLTAVGDIQVDDKVEAGFGHGCTDDLQLDGIVLDATLFPDAKSLLPLASAAIAENRSVEASKIEINYLRNQVAEKARA